MKILTKEEEQAHYKYVRPYRPPPANALLIPIAVRRSRVAF